MPEERAAAVALEAAAATYRLALGLAYRGEAYFGWQSQPGGQTVQDHVQRALSHFVLGETAPVADFGLRCSGRTDTGVHALNQVVHLDVPVQRPPHAWVRGVNRFLPPDIAVQWCAAVGPEFHARRLARRRRYVYLIRESASRPAFEAQACGWSVRPLDGAAMQAAADLLLGEHDFSAFRSSQCQALSPVKTLYRAEVTRHGSCWRIDVEGNAFLHHMVRNLVGCLVYVGQGRHPPQWLGEVLAARRRDLAAPTYPPQGLYFLGPVYDPSWKLPEYTPGMDWLPGAAAEAAAHPAYCGA
ncbi:tRNA pseudouridine(38-40) synthase TruA [Amphibiibacter pelophylacis]|uniref:tRNA pseudouridine(38-40) synthase TruA n=1 Tax=Amphibiibacter pelophylacis TaxID=1799477 RepID=A0ACC6P3B5_9BURK